MHKDFKLSVTSPMQLFFVPLKNVFKIIFYLLVLIFILPLHVHMSMPMHEPVVACVWRSEYNLWALVVSSTMGELMVIRLAAEHSMGPHA